MREGTRYSVKKRMMFVTHEDYYFFTYNILFLLNELGCNNERKAFKYHSKLPLLIDFVADTRMIEILRKAFKNKKVNNYKDREELYYTFTNAKAREGTISALLQALEKRNIICLKKEGMEFSIWYNPNEKVERFLEGSGFEEEKSNAKTLKSVIRRLSILKPDTLEQRLFKQFNINLDYDAPSIH